jgi:hypothetical protein
VLVSDVSISRISSRLVEHAEQTRVKVKRGKEYVPASRRVVLGSGALEGEAPVNEGRRESL